MKLNKVVVKISSHPWATSFWAMAQGDDGGRSLLRTQAMIVASVGHGASDHLVVLGEAIGQTGNGRDI